MDNYPYIIASLPSLSLDFDVSTFDYGQIRDTIYNLSLPSDKRLIDWLEFGFSADHLSEHFYIACAKSKNSFIRQYYKFDYDLRTLKVAFLQKTATNIEFEERKRAQAVLEINNILDREQQFDKLIWEKINEISSFELLNINSILSFLAKGKIVDRWSRLDKQVGAEFLTRLISEVRGTFSGVDYKD